MAGHQPDTTATWDVPGRITTDDVTQEFGTNLPNGFSASEGLQYEYNPAAALDAEISLDFLAEYPEFDVDFDWENFYNHPLPAQKALDRTWTVSATAPESHFLHDFSYDPNEEASADQTLDKSFGDAMKPESHSSPCSPNTHCVSPLPQTQSRENTSNPADLLAFTVEDLSGLFGSFDASGGRDLDSFSPWNFNLPDNPSGLDYLQSLQLIGGEAQPAMSPDARCDLQRLPYSTGNSAIQDYKTRRVARDGSPSAKRVALAGSSEPNPTNENSAILTNLRRLSKDYQGGATQRQPDRSRTQRKNLYTQSSAYTPLTKAPDKWDIFEYTKDGELDPSRLFSAEEIDRFLFTHPLHQGYRDLKESLLRIRVHKTPASSAKRFPNRLMCRFKDCPLRTINQGQLLIVVDELSVQHPNHDPFLNAAYFHLWCVERHCNFPKICATLHVSAEGRAVPKEGDKNKFCLSPEEEKVVEDFVQACANGRRGIDGILNPWVATCPDQQTNGCSHYDQPSYQHNGTLGHQLAITKLHYGGQGRINLRKVREDRAGYEGANIIRHLGDLSKEAELREFSRSHKNQNQLKSNPKNVRIYGTKRDIDKYEDGQTLDDEIVQANKKPKLNTAELDFGTTTSPSQDSLPYSASRRQSTTPEDESEGEIKLQLLAAQKRRMALEIEHAKATEDAFKIKLEKINKKKRARYEVDDDGDEDGSEVKRQRA